MTTDQSALPDEKCECGHGRVVHERQDNGDVLCLECSRTIKPRPNVKHPAWHPFAPPALQPLSSTEDAVESARKALINAIYAGDGWLVQVVLFQKAVEAAIRAEAEAPQDGFVIDGVLSHDASDEWTPEAEESARDAILDFIESRGWQFGGAMGVAR